MAQPGEVVAAASVGGAAGVVVAVVVQGWGIGRRRGVDQAALVGLEQAPGPDEAEGVAGFQVQVGSCSQPR